MPVGRMFDADAGDSLVVRWCIAWRRVTHRLARQIQKPGAFESPSAGKPHGSTTTFDRDHHNKRTTRLPSPGRRLSGRSVQRVHQTAE